MEGIRPGFQRDIQICARDQGAFFCQHGVSRCRFSIFVGRKSAKGHSGTRVIPQFAFVLLDQPTRGLDVGSIEYVHEQILAMRGQQRAILLISSDLDELFRIADRILVLHRGKLVADLPVGKTSIDEIGYLMLEGKFNEKQTH
jgi:simple sugar transport system ATP-binding protein